MYVYAFCSCRFLQLLSKQDGAQNKKIKLYFYFISLFITLSDLLHAHRLNARIYIYVGRGSGSDYKCNFLKTPFAFGKCRITSQETYNFHSFMSKRFFPYIFRFFPLVFFFFFAAPSISFIAVGVDNLHFCFTTTAKRKGNIIIIPRKGVHPVGGRCSTYTKIIYV